MNINDIKPYLSTIEYTKRLLEDQGNSFNEAGQSFNQAGVMFGGVYGNEGKYPNLLIDSDKVR